jgi:hypothetical protein
MTRGGRRLAVRDQEPSVFAWTLLRLRDAVDALGVALVDAEGETVDYVAVVSPFDIKIAAAEASVLVDVIQMSRFPVWASTEKITVRGSARTLHVEILPGGYSLVVLLPVRAFTVSPRAMSEAIVDLCAEAGLDLPVQVGQSEERWRLVDIYEDPDRRPEAVWLEGRWERVTVIGRVALSPHAREVGYRVQLESGGEFMLIREPLARWYADVAPASLSDHPS